MAVTQFEIDNALMAGRAYFDTRASINRFPVPQGWVEFNHRALDSGFEATSFTDGSRIVISYAGTDFTDISDWTQANIPLAFGFGSDQLREALNKSKFQIHIQATERFCLPTCRRGRIIAPSSRKLLVF